MALLLKSIETSGRYGGGGASIKPFSFLVPCYICVDVCEGTQKRGGAAMHGMVSIDFQKVTLFVDRISPIITCDEIKFVQLKIEVANCLVTFQFSKKEDLLRLSRYLQRSYGRRDNTLTYNLK